MTDKIKNYLNWRTVTVSLLVFCILFLLSNNKYILWFKIYLSDHNDVSLFHASPPNAYLRHESYIAHGGGAINGALYTNSAEAVKNSIQNGFIFIELDLLVTSDGHIVAAHDWNTFNKITGHAEDKDAVLSLAEFMERKIYDKYTPLSWKEICAILELNKNVILVTDKIKNYSLLQKQIPYADRMIVEVFSEKDYYNALQSGFPYPAYCIWDERQLKKQEFFNFKMVTASGKSFALFPDKLKKMHEQGIVILLYNPGSPAGVNLDDTEFFKKHIGTFISKFYTDKWIPKDKTLY